MRWGFKKDAKKLALEIREELGLSPYETFDPYALAHEYGIPVYPLSEFGRHEEARDAVAHFANGRAVTFSAALVPFGSKRLILDNDAHMRERRRNSVSHEMAHVLLEHVFKKVLLTADGCRCFDKDKEDEADWLGGELLIPYDAAERAARQSWTDEQVAKHYDVSVPLARMRMNSSGARKKISRIRAKYPRW